MSHSATVLNYDQLDYASAWELQLHLMTRRAADLIPDTLILLEHPPVFTIGRTGRSEHWSGDEAALRDAGFPVYHVERGGSITYHAPGQLVGYPILKLAAFCPGPKSYMFKLEEVLIRTLADWGLVAGRIPGLIGVWVGEQKIGAMGVRISRGITIHGFSLNVDLDLTPFSRIVPCGIAGCRITSMVSLLGQPVDRTAVRAALTKRFAEVFELEWKEPVERGNPVPGLIAAQPA